MRMRHVTHSYYTKKMCDNLYKCIGFFLIKFYLKNWRFFSNINALKIKKKILKISRNIPKLRNSISCKVQHKIFSI